MWMWVQLGGCSVVASLTMHLWGHHSKDWGSLVTVHSSGVGPLSEGRRGYRRRHDYLLVRPLATTGRKRYGFEPHINFRAFVSHDHRKFKGNRSLRIKLALFLAVSPNSEHDTSNICSLALRKTLSSLFMTPPYKTSVVPYIPQPIAHTDVFSDI